MSVVQVGAAVFEIAVMAARAEHVVPVPPAPVEATATFMVLPLEPKFNPCVVELSAMIPSVVGAAPPATGTLKDVAGEKSQVLPLAIKVPALEFVFAVIALQGVVAEGLEAKVQLVLVAPASSTQLTVIFVPWIKFRMGRCVWAPPLACTV